VKIIKKFTRVRSFKYFRINPDHRAVAYCEGIRTADANDFEKLWQRFLNSVVDHEKITILNALGCTKEPALIQKLLSATLTDSIRYQDKNTAFLSVLSSNPENVDVVFEYVTTNYKAWSEK
jgi:ERAP1-like C-terminal domain